MPPLSCAGRATCTVVQWFADTDLALRNIIQVFQPVGAVYWTATEHPPTVDWIGQIPMGN